MGNPASMPAASQRDSRTGTPRDRVHLLVCTNALFLQHAAVCLASLLTNNRELFFDIVIVRRMTEELDETKLRQSLRQFPNHSLRFQAFAMRPGLVLPLNPETHYTVDTYTRLWVEEFFPADVSRVLYLDADIVVVGSIEKLWRVDLGGALLGTVDIPGSDRGVTRLGMSSEDGYFNAGMLVIDLDQWRESNAGETVLAYVRANPERVLYDQDALNACFHSRRKRLDYKWNAIWPFFGGPLRLPLQRAELETVRREAVIIHFNGGFKPWSYFCDHPRKADYEKYLRLTEWRDFVPPDRTPLNMLRKGLGAILPASVKRPIKAALAAIPATRRLAKPA
ncbi:MAG: glycosyltransferase family 8 protein [Acetobacteraceae bacterium]